MELLSNLFGSLASGVIRLAVAVGIIAATYLFLVKPVLHTTDNAINKSFDAAGSATSGARSITRSTRPIARSGARCRRSFHQSKTAGGHDSKKLLRCVQRANGNVNRMQACARRF